MKDWELEYYEELRAWERVEEAKRKLSELEAKLNQKDPFDKIIQIKDSKAGGVIEVPVCNFNFEEVSYGLPTSPTWRDL